MPNSLHSEKIKDEKNAFVEELYKVFPSKDMLISGNLSSAASAMHKVYLALYVMNYHKSVNLKTTYFEHLITATIESEALFFNGYKNAAYMQMRCAVESAFKLLYFETHPFEWQIHLSGDFDMRGVEYREFLYRHPKFIKLNFEKEQFEGNWKELCQYSHYDINIVKDISCVIEITNALSNKRELNDFVKKIKSSIREIVCILFMVDPRWLEGIEKAYFDYVFEILYTKEERRLLIDKLGIV